MIATAGDANTDPAHVTAMAEADVPKLLPDTMIVPPAVVPVQQTRQIKIHVWFCTTSALVDKTMITWCWL